MVRKLLCCHIKMACCSAAVLLPRNGRRRSKAGEIYGDPDSRISTAVYERRLATLSFTHTAWSPTVHHCMGGSHFTILAAGTKAGRVWLWRYTPPVPSLVGGGTAEREGFALVGQAPAKELSMMFAKACSK